MTEPLTANHKKQAAKSIVHVLDSLWVGGLERTVVRLAIAQKEAGDNVQIVTIWGNGPLTASLNEAGIEISCMHKKSGLDLSTIKNIRKILLRDVDVVHTHNLLPHYYATAASIGLKLRKISTRHDMGEHLKGKRIQLLYKLSLYQTDSVVAVCEAAKRKFINNNIVPEQILSVVYNGIPPPIPRENKEQDKNSARKKLQLPLEGPIVGSIGRLNIVKGYKTLIAVFAEVIKTYPTAKLVIVGDGPERKNLQEQINKLEIGENVILLGERNDVEEMLEQFDIFALTSLTEGFSVALVEAAWAGLPIVATDVGGNREIVQDGLTGFLAEPGNLQDLTQKIEKLLSDDHMRRSFGARGRSRAENNWTLDLMRERYQCVYQKPTNGR
jgi:glycosyltransferase involved in cell wall biosynthesis